MFVDISHRKSIEHLLHPTVFPAQSSHKRGTITPLHKNASRNTYKIFARLHWITPTRDSTAKYFHKFTHIRGGGGGEDRDSTAKTGKRRVPFQKWPNFNDSCLIPTFFVWEKRNLPWSPLVPWHRSSLPWSPLMHPPPAAHTRVKRGHQLIYPYPKMPPPSLLHQRSTTQMLQPPALLFG